MSGGIEPGISIFKVITRSAPFRERTEAARQRGVPGSTLRHSSLCGQQWRWEDGTRDQLQTQPVLGNKTGVCLLCITDKEKLLLRDQKASLEKSQRKDSSCLGAGPGPEGPPRPPAAPGRAKLWAQMVKNLPARQETQVKSLMLTTTRKTASAAPTASQVPEPHVWTTQVTGFPSREYCQGQQLSNPSPQHAREGRGGPNCWSDTSAVLLSTF